MDTKILIIGTDHHYQTGSCNNNDTALFTSTIKNIINKHSVFAIFEEMNEEGLEKYDVSSTISQNICIQLNIKHRFIDPSKSEREGYGIKERGKIKALGLLNNWGQDIIKNKIIEQDMKREDIWLNKIQKHAKDTVLFICGSDHSDRFLSLLLKNNITSEMLFNNYNPSHRKGVLV
jgi:hypothetical protein